MKTFPKDSEISSNGTYNKINNLERQESAHEEDVYQTFSRRDELVAQEIENLEAGFSEEISDVTGRFTSGHVGNVNVLTRLYNSE